MRVKGRAAPASLVDRLRGRADVQPDDRAYTFLENGEREGATLTWGGLERRSRAIAAAIHALAPAGARALLLCPPGLDFVPAFFGALFARVVAVPCYAPRIGRPDRSLQRLEGIVRDASVSLVVAPQHLVDRADLLAAAIPALERAAWLSLDTVPIEHASAWRPPRIDRDTLAFLQYTSGSTGSPRGVMVTHGNLLHNLAYADALSSHTAESAGVSWLPVNHDMGLIQGVLQPAFSGFPAWLMAPAAFLQRPARWLQAISRVRATLSGGPNFAYDLCVRRISDEERCGLDLRAWRLAFNGAEPLRQATLDAFVGAFGACGFQASAFRPAYGLAESTLLVSAGAGATTACGLPAEGMRIAIVDPGTRRECKAGREGEIWVAGGSVAAGYWNRPHETAASFRAQLAGGNRTPFLRTGDLGVVRDGALHVTGRIKDVLIVRGIKHYPHDLEASVEGALPEVRAGGCAAFGFSHDGEECVAVAAEVGRHHDRSIIDAIRQIVADAHGIQLDAVVLLQPGTLPKTTSGKLQRYACREGHVQGTLAPLAQWVRSTHARTLVSEVA